LSDRKPSKKYKVVSVGGTFDLLHKGHRTLLLRAFELGEHVLIGVTSDAFVSKMGKTGKNNYQTRVTNLINFLNKSFPNTTYEIRPLDAYFGPRIYNSDVEALVASEETSNKVNLANKIRIAKGLKPLKLIVIETIKSEDGKPISSTSIRMGKIDCEGKILGNEK